MNVKSIAISLLGCLAILFLAAGPASAQCVINFADLTTSHGVVITYTGPVDLNAEGLTERAPDIKISSASGMNCFTAGAHILVQYPVVMSVPDVATFNSTPVGKYWDFYDQNADGTTGPLSLNSVSVVQPNPLTSGGYVTKLDFYVDSGTTNANAYIVVENLRFDVTGTTGPSCKPGPCYANLPDTSDFDVTVSNNDLNFTSGAYKIGTVRKTVQLGYDLDIGWGFENGVCPWSVTYCGYPNVGGTNGGYLVHRASFDFSTNGAWKTDFPFRYVGEKSQNSIDIPIGQTDLVLDIEDIPSGVTVTVPTSLYICGSEGPADTWTTSQTTSTVGGRLVVVYQTESTVNAQGKLLVTTTNATHQTNVYSCSALLDEVYPNVITVGVGNPSGNNDLGNMVANLRVVMGPTVNAPSGAPKDWGSDVQPTAIPRYLYYFGDAMEPTREIIGNNGNPVEYFYLNPTETVLLFPYVTNYEAPGTTTQWNTGIEIANTGLDQVTDSKGTFSVFGNTGQAGALDFYLFPSAADSTATPWACTTSTATNTLPLCTFGRGLDANGNLQPGSDFADTITDLLTAIGQSGKIFDGYIIVVAHFNFGHGSAIVFNPSGDIAQEPALILGGHCSYSPNNAQSLPSGAPDFPACSSARQGDITKLPERLEN